VLPALRHSWIQEEGGEIQSPGLINVFRFYNVSSYVHNTFSFTTQFTVHSDLGRVVQAIIREFEKHPPPFLNEVDSNVSPQNNDVATVQRSVSAFNIPELAVLRFDQLEELNSDPQYLDDFAEEMTAVKMLNDELLGLMGEIEGLASE
jgi:ESCRT-I complex subunit VPS37